MDFKKIKECEKVNWIEVAQDRVQWFCEHGNKPLGSLEALHFLSK
jgi:hypothetical protein